MVSYICLATSYKLMLSYLCSHGYSHEQCSGSCRNQEKNPKGIIPNLSRRQCSKRKHIVQYILIGTHLSLPHKFQSLSLSFPFLNLLPDTAFSSDFCAWTDNDLGLFACSTTTIGAQISWYFWCSKLVKMTWKQGRNHFILPCGPHWPQTCNSLTFTSLLQGLYVGHHTWAK